METLPDIPRVFTAMAEWGSCLVFVAVNKPRTRNRTETVVALILGLVFLLGAQEWIGNWTLPFWSLGMFLAALIMITYIWVCVETDLKGAIYLGGRAFILSELIASFEWQLRYFFVDLDQNESLWGAVPWVIVTYGLAFYVAYFILRPVYLRSDRIEVSWSSVAWTLLIGLITFTVSNLSFVTVDTPFSGSGATEIFYIRTLVDLLGFGLLHAQRVYQLKTLDAVELEATSRLLKAQHEQYWQSKANMEEVNKKYHDLKHYISALRAEESAERRLEYLDNLESSIKEYELQVSTGNPVLDTVLTLKLRQCAEREVTLTSVVDGSLLAFVDPLDLSALVGNALDNAIESACQLPNRDQRLIKFAVFQQGNMVMVRVENYFDHELSFVDGLPVTTKEEARNHGYGLKNIRNITESYNGTFTVSPDENWFCIRALIPLPAS